MLKIMKFSAIWCQPCKMMIPIWDKLKQNTVGVDFVSIDVDTDSDIAIKFNIQVVPTIVFIKDGVEVERTTGLIKEAEIVKIIDLLK